MFTYSTELDLQTYILNNFDRYFDFEYFASEMVIEGGRIDVLGMDKDTVYVVEIKRDFITQLAIDQLSSYLPKIGNKFVDKKIIGIAVAPVIHGTLNLESLPSYIKVKT